MECAAAEVISRKIVPSSFIEINSVGKCFTYKCSRNSESLILKSLSPKEALYNECSYLDEGDKLECENLFVAVNKRKPYKFDKINHSGRHKAQTFTTKEYTMAKISKQLSSIPELIPPKELIIIEQ